MIKLSISALCYVCEGCSAILLRMGFVWFRLLSFIIY